MRDVSRLSDGRNDTFYHYISAVSNACIRLSQRHITDILFTVGFQYRKKYEKNTEKAENARGTLVYT